MAVSSAYTRVSTTWTGSRADALRQAVHMTKESFADYLGISARTVAYWRAKPHVVPQQEKQEILDTALRRASDEAKERFAFLTAGQNDSPGLVPRQFTYRDTTGDDAFAPADAGDAVTLLDALAGADMTDLPEVTQGRWIAG